MGLGFDWDGDGKDGLFDDMVTLNILESDKKKKNSNGSGGCGTCAIAVLAVPALVILAALKSKGL